MNNLPYDRTSKDSIYEYALNLLNKSFKDILKEKYELKEDSAPYNYNDFKGKGNLGTLIEKEFFLYDPNTKSEADFSEAGIELKVTPIIQNKNGLLRAKERLVLGMIDYMEDYKEEDFIQSHIYKKCALMLLINYLYEPTKERLDYIIKFVTLFSFPKEDLEIIKNDYKIIINKIKNGKAHEISEGDTNYLGACTKGADSHSTTKQPNSPIEAMRRAFCLKNSYMTYILNKYIANKDNQSESVIKDSNILKHTSFEDYVLSQLKPYYNTNVDSLCERFDVQKNNKSFTYLLAKKMLNIEKDKIEEFEKSNIRIKAIRVNKNGKIKESMSFPAFEYMKIIKETDWYESELYDMFSSAKYLFMIFQFNENNELYFKRAMFWHIPESDLNGEVRKVWEETINRIKNNNYNDLPKMKDNTVCHVRPHARNSKDTFPTPDGKAAVKKCFWLNSNYIKEQISKKESED